MKINYDLNGIKPFIINDYETDFVMGGKDISEEKDSLSCQSLILKIFVE